MVAAAVRATAKGELLVWVDNTRMPAAQQYEKAHPDLKMRIVTIPPDAGYVPTKISLANRTRSGWPDVVFLANPAEAATLASEKFGYAAPLDDLVPKSVRDGFTPGSLDTCTFGGKAYCLRNDIAPTVLWYDAQLMKRYGYQVPKTWADYQQIGLKAAEEHPGTIVGAVNGKYGAGIYFGSSGCPTRDTLSLTAVHIDLAGPNCTRVADLLQPLARKKAVTTVVPIDPGFAKFGKGDKILMLPAPAWFGDFMFGPAFKVPKGRIAAAPMPTWPGEDKPYAGQVGGGAFLVSAHAGTRTEQAADLVRWMTTDVNLQAKQPTYPAFTAAGEEVGRGQVEGPVLRLRPDARPHRGGERAAPRLRRGPLRGRLAEQLQRHVRQGGRLRRQPPRAPWGVGRTSWRRRPGPAGTRSDEDAHDTPPARRSRRPHR